MALFGTVNCVKNLLIKNENLVKMVVKRVKNWYTYTRDKYIFFAL